MEVLGPLGNKTKNMSFFQTSKLSKDFQSSAEALKSGNALLLKGGKEASRNRAVFVGLFAWEMRIRNEQKTFVVLSDMLKN